MIHVILNMSSTFQIKNMAYFYMENNSREEIKMIMLDLKKEVNTEEIINSTIVKLTTIFCSSDYIAATPTYVCFDFCMI